MVRWPAGGRGPVAPARLFYSCFAKTVAQASWMVATFMAPVLLAVGVARCAGPLYYAAGLLSLLPFVVIPVALGSVVTLLLVNVFPARRTKDILVLLSMLAVALLYLLFRLIRPERLVNPEGFADFGAQGYTRLPDRQIPQAQPCRGHGLDRDLFAPDRRNFARRAAGRNCRTRTAAGRTPRR